MRKLLHSRIDSSLLELYRDTNKGEKESSVKEAGNRKATFTDILGRKIKTIPLNGLQTQTTLENTKGVYFVKVLNCNDNTESVQKIIFQ